MSAPSFDVIDTDIEESSDTIDSVKRNNSPAAKLERRRRIEEINEQRLMREEWGD